jgi:regulator of sirC expression with transglutaminase-like and TPR domain
VKPVTPTDRFLALVRGPEAALPLDEAALLLAAHAEPDLDITGQLVRLDDLAASCSEPTVEGVRTLLFGELALQGNTSDYDDPRNSFLDQVLDRKVGIPISLSVLTIEVGRRVGVAFEGIGLPGHFLVRQVGDPEHLMDPFHHGRLLDMDACASLFQSLFGPAAPFSPSLLAPVGPRQILARMLANLKNSYNDRGDAEALEWVLRLRAAIPGVPARELADLARVLVNLGRFGEAADALDRLVLAGQFDESDNKSLAGRAAMLRARLN